MLACTSGSGSLLSGTHCRAPVCGLVFCQLQRVAHSRRAHDEAGKAGGHVPPVSPTRKRPGTMAAYAGGWGGEGRPAACKAGLRAVGRGGVWAF